MGFATKKQAADIFRALQERDADRQARMPDHRAALDQASVARQRLKSLGWASGQYCPKNGDEFALIQWGSTGVFAGVYVGKWPDGHIYCGDFLLHPREVMFKEFANLSDAERDDLSRSVESDKQFMERQLKTFLQD